MATDPNSPYPPPYPPYPPPPYPPHGGPPPYPPPGGGAGAWFRKFLTFDAYIGGTLIKILFYVGLVAIAIGALVVLVAGFGQMRWNPIAPLIGLILAILYVTVGSLFWRFICELWMVAFDIHKRLGEIRDRLPPR